MFYDKDLMNDPILSPLWRAGNNLDSNSNEDINIVDQCNKLEKMIKTDRCRAKDRISLRTSTVMIAGAATVYKDKMKGLLNDVMEVDQRFCLRGRRSSNVNEKDASSANVTSPEKILSQESASTNNSSSTSATAPEETLRQESASHKHDSSASITSPEDMSKQESSSEKHESSASATSSEKMSRDGEISLQTSSKKNGSSASLPSPERMLGQEKETSLYFENINIRKRKTRPESMEFEGLRYNVIVPELTASGSNQQNVSQIDKHENNGCNSHDSISLNLNISKDPENSHSLNNSKTDKSVQVDIPYKRRRSNDSRIKKFDRNLPFCHMTIYESYNTRIPKKIVFSSLNSEAKKIKPNVSSIKKSK